MDNENKNTNDFEFTYSAPTNAERKEIESIRNGYLPKDSSTAKLELLRKLDGLVKNIPMAVSLAVGVVGTLIFGLGLTMFLEWAVVAWGVILSIVGLVPIVLAYPTFIWLTKHLKNRYSQQIINLSNELLNENNNEN